MTLFSASYGQELTYLKCAPSDQDVLAAEFRSTEILLLDEESMKWSFFSLHDKLKDEDFETTLTNERVSRYSSTLRGTLNEKIEEASSKALILSYDFGFGFNRVWRYLDRFTGEMHQGTAPSSSGSVLLICVPITESRAKELFQEVIIRRDEIVKANEAERLF